MDRIKELNSRLEGELGRFLSKQNNQELQINRYHDEIKSLNFKIEKLERNL